MTRLEIAKQKAKEKLSDDQFQKIDTYIESIGVSGTKRSKIWEDYLNGKIILNTWTEPDPLTDIDGHYYFWPSSHGGCWSEFSLRLIADTLQYLNEPYEQHLKNI
jgi:hypothetical protein